ncbi:MAG: zinc ribbon domain-containing protein [Clostridia bacterium]|nr:zinc ribbon domain-containing protein [Clostridia bacterium]
MSESDYIFKGILICGMCGWHLKGKMDRKKKIYVCGNYDKRGECFRNSISEKEVTDFINANNVILSENNALKIINKTIEVIKIDQKNAKRGCAKLRVSKVNDM